MSESDELIQRNPGPNWGYAFMYFVNRVMPWPVMCILLRVGAFVAMCFMRDQRRYSRRFLCLALGREASWLDSWKHFTEFAKFLVRRFDVAGGTELGFEPYDGSKERIKSLTSNNQQAMHGTFHFGNSDLMGFWLSDFDVSIRMVRYQVDNSSDLKWLKERYGDTVGFLWVNKPENLLFTLKNAVQEGHSIALKCDRVEHSSKLEVFDFMGEKRWFPFTIYYLAVLFDLPVLFSFGVPSAQHRTGVYSSSVYYPKGANKREKLESARAHFRETLILLEGLVKSDPYQWFNFYDSIPVYDPVAASHASNL